MALGATGRQADPHASRERTEVRDLDPMTTARILVADDQESNVLLLDRLLRTAGVQEVIRITDARQVVPRCLEARPDLVVLDLHMPHLDGVAVLRELAATLDADAFLPVLVLTADTTEVAKVRALEAGAKDFLTKPLDRDDVLLRVRNHLETASLYQRVQAENQRLAAELAHRTRAAALREAERERRRGRIRHVLDRDGVEMAFQPVADLGTGEIVAVEALARFRSVDGRTPDEWFADAADVGLSVELEVTAVEAALRRLGDLPPRVAMGINVSPLVATSDELADCLAGVPSGRVVLELTEHVPVDDYDLLLDRLNRLRDAGIGIAVDDAGAGYAGLQHIIALTPDVLKLDRSLVTGIEVDPARRALAASMVHFAAEIDALLVAEGIENAGALATLQALGVSLGQGYHLARPGLLPLTDDHLDIGLHATADRTADS